MRRYFDTLGIVLLVSFVLVFGALAAGPAQKDQAKAQGLLPEKLRGPGVFPDNFFNSRIIYTGARGCTACHEDLYSLVKHLSPMLHVAAPTTYGKQDDVRTCLPCHRLAGPLTGPKLGDIMHASHYNNIEFGKKYNGNCFSCHATDTKGNLVLFDEVKYDATFGGFIDPNSEPTMKWVKGRGFPKGHMTGFDMDKDMKGSISFSQNVITDMKDAFKVINFNLPDLKPDTYKLTVKGMVKTEKTYTLVDLQRKPQVEITATKTCFVNGIGGTMISNLKYSGVALKSILDEVGVQPEANIVKLDGVDGWGFPFSLDLLTQRGAILGIAVNGQDFPLDQGYPVVVIIPGEGGASWVKHLGVIELSRAPEKEIPIASKDHPDNPNEIQVNAGFLVPPKDGTEVKAPVHLEGWAFSWNGEPVKAVLFSGDYGKTWRHYKVPEPVDPYRWVYWKFDWYPPAAGRYLLKVKAVTTSGKQQPKEDNLVLVVK